MTKIIPQKNKITRRWNGNIWGRSKSPYLKRQYAPGQHGPTVVRKLSDYRRQLEAKQRLKGYYGRVSERQFRAIFKEAERLKGDTGNNMVILLERRLQTVVYRLKFASTIFAARQLVSHKHICVNGRTVNIASYSVKPGDVISVHEKSRHMTCIQQALQDADNTMPDYVECDTSALRGTFLRDPEFNEVPYGVPMEPQLIVAFLA
jgi:small subunit ribosomal protein S4